MSIISKIICIFAPDFSNLFKNSIIMVNKAVLTTLFTLCMGKCKNNLLCFDVHVNHVEDVLTLLRASNASWEITHCYGDNGDEFVSFSISDF